MWGSRFGLQGLRCGIKGLGLRVWVAESRAEGSGFRLQGWGCKIEGFGFRDWGAGFRVRDLGFGAENKYFSEMCCGSEAGSY